MAIDDRTRLQHMLDSANEALSFVEGKKREDLDSERMLVHSLVRCIEIIGEAAAGISQDCRDKHSAVPWQEIVAMRNRLIHGYFDVDLDRVWDTLKDDLPPLISALDEILADDTPMQSSS
jgi:uncharacterized protein with HEPN domain